MVNRQDIRDSFSIFGVELEDPAIIEKCAELCAKYHMSETDIADQWMSYIVNLNEDIKPSVDKLTSMEKKVLATTTLSKVSQNSYTPTAPVTVYGGSSSIMDIEPMDDFPVLKNTPKDVTPAAVRSPMRIHRNIHTPRMLFSPSSFSEDAIKTSETYEKRTNKLHVVERFGDTVESCVWKTSRYGVESVKLSEHFVHVTKNTRYMHSTLEDKIQVSKRQSELICAEIRNKYSLEDPVPVHRITVENRIFAGKIVCDGAYDGKLNLSSILLENSVLSIRGENVLVDLTLVEEFSIFPGQIIVIEGKNPTGKKIVAEKIFTDVYLPMCKTPMEFSSAREPLQIVVAVGPYTLSNNINYQPLHDLLTYVAENQPHVLILVGPIVDCSHPHVKENSMVESFSECFDNLLSNVLTQTSEKHTKIVVVSSWKEAGNLNVYPTPPNVSKHENALLFAPDPCIINISGVNVGISATDVIMHLGKEELFCSAAGTGAHRLPRLASHVFKQMSFYPLRPPNEEMCVDDRLLLESAQIPHKPHLMILPSDLRCFIKDIDDTVFVNPEKLTKGTIGNNFTRIQVLPAVDGQPWSPKTHILAQVLKI